MASATPEQILALEDARYAAMIAVDEAALDNCFGEDLVYVHSSGLVDTKASYIAAIRGGKFRYLKCDRYEQSVRIYGGTALVAGRAVFETMVEGAPSTLRLRFLNVWTETPAGWKFVGWQSCALPA